MFQSRSLAIIGCLVLGVAADLAGPSRLQLHRRQTQLAQCTYAKWSYNDQGETPCQLLTKLGSKCQADFSISSINNETAPYQLTSANANPCLCNVVAYNLMAACSWCQPAIFSTDWVTETVWSSGCSPFNPTGIPTSVSASDIKFPSWATNPNNGKAWSSFDTSLLVAAANPSTTGGPRPTGKPSSSNKGPIFVLSLPLIIAAVVAGVWLLIALVVCVIYCVRQKKRKAWYGRTAAYYRNGGMRAWDQNSAAYNERGALLSTHSSYQHSTASLVHTHPPQQQQYYHQGGY